MTDGQFTAWKKAAEDAIVKAGLEKRLRFSRLATRNNAANFLEIVLKGTQESWSGASVTVEDGGARFPTTADVDEVARAISTLLSDEEQ